MKYSLRSLIIAMLVLPPLLALAIFAVQQKTAKRVRLAIPYFPPGSGVSDGQFISEEVLMTDSHAENRP
jgi:hypothetical protein